MTAPRAREKRRPRVRSARALAAAALLALASALALPAASETVTPTAPSGGICARTDQVRDAIVARIGAARDCTQVTAAHLASLRGKLKLAGKGISSLKAGDFAGLSKLKEIWLENNQLTTLPPGLFDGLSAVEILQLNGNHLVSLPVGAFDGLSTLWLLHLHDNRLSRLPVGVFDGLSSLQQLLLVDNRLTRLPAGVFGGLADLRGLDLEEAGLSSLPAGVFDGLSSLKLLNLEYNQLSDLPAEVFDGLSSLTELSLRANQLSHLPGDVFDGLGSLNELRLDQNQLTSLPADVFDGLSSLAELFLALNRLTSAGLPADVFDGLSSLWRLQLLGNQLTTLPDGLFEGLSALRSLELQDNSVDPMVLTVSLERVGNNGFKATVPAGAPFAMTLPVSVANGSIDGGATTLGIPVGAVESGALAVTRTAGTKAPVTADIGPSLPAPPRRNAGFEFVRGPWGLPREILPETLPALSVADALATEGEDSTLVFVVTLDRAASGTVTVSYATADGTAAAGEDYEVASGTLAFAAGETEKSVEVAVLDDTHAEGEETLVFALNEASGATIADGEATGTVAPSRGICARTDQVRDAIVARIGAARDCTQVTAARLAELRGKLRLDDKGISSLKPGDFAGLSKLTEIWLDNNQLTTLPSDLFDGLSALEILQLGGNQLDTLQSDVFDGLPALWFLDLSNNRLTRLSAGAFKGLPALERLLLGTNQLSTLPMDVFDGLSALWFLDLEEVGLSALPEGVFDGLSALEELNLEHNQLSDLPAEVFDGLSSLTELSLRANQLSSLPEEVFDGLGSLSRLRLDQNQLTNLPEDVFDGLSSLAELLLHLNRLTSAGLPADVFDGLPSLYRLQLRSNQLTTLPDGVFEGLSALEFLEVQYNLVNPMVLTVSLERVGNNGFKATVPAGAPFTMTLPVSVANGSIDGGATTLGIPAGAVESGTLTVIRTAGTTAAVTADIGPSLPVPPHFHNGYELARATGLPREILPETLPALSVADARATEGGDSALVFVVTLDRAASGTVTVSYATADGTAAGGEDYEAASGTLEFAAGETEKPVSVATTDDSMNEEDETFTLRLSSPANATLGDAVATGTIADDDEPPLTASFSGIPAEHDGRSAFTFRVAFSEEIGISYTTLRDESFTVTKGDVTKARRVDGRHDLWEITVEPDSDGDVTITLRGNRECGTTGAICTREDDPRPLGNSPSATVEGSPAQPLTASFSGIPAEHDGRSAFTFRVAFSEEIGISYTTLRDESFTVTKGDVTKARRVDGRHDLWKITVEPDSDGDVTITLRGNRECGTTGAICTRDGRSLSTSLSATVAGLLGISVVDARVEESAGAVLEFAVTLERAAADTVTVDYATSDGSAQAGDDYTATSGTLTFRAGESAQTIEVAVLDDSHDEGEETLTLRLSNPSGGRLADGEATGTIKNTDPMPKAWLARFGRAASDHAVGAIEGRWRSGAEARPQTHLTLGGRRVENPFDFGRVRDSFNASEAGSDGADPRLDPESTWARMDRLKAESLGLAGGGPAGGGLAGSGIAGGPLAGGNPGPLGGSLTGSPLAGLSHSVPRSGPDGGEDAVRSALLNTLGLRDPRGLGDLRQILMGSSFFYARALDENGEAAGGSGWLGNWSAWGETAATRFSGADGPLSLDGEVATATLGADRRWGRWHGGVALSYSEGDGVYTHPEAAGGAVTSTLTSLHPFARYELNDRTSLWGVLGYGSGALRLTPAGAETGIDTDLDTAMAAFGGRGVFSVRSSRFGAFELAVVSDVRVSQTVSDSVENLMGTTGATSRVRVMLEGSGSMPLATGGVLKPTLEAGLRYDDGDAETGAGLEIGAGLGYAAGVLAVEVKGRMLLAHEDTEYEEWGFSGSIRYRPRSDGRGLSMNLGSAWGATQSGVQSLWSGQDASSLVRGAAMNAAQRFQAELGYGFTGRGKTDALWMPFLGAESADGGAQSLRMGVKLTSGPNLEAGLEFGRLENGRGVPERAVQLRGALRW